MDRRTKILAGAFLAFIAYALISSMVYPWWIEPMLSIDDRIAEQQERFDELQDGESEVEQARREYRWFLDRVGSFDKVKVENALRERLNTLIAKHKLEGVNTSGGSGKMTTVGKSGAELMRLTVDATATLESAIGFLKDVAELPQLVRLGNVAIYPSSSSRRKQSKDQVHLRAPIEVLVLPSQRILGERLTDEELEQPPAYVRHDGRDYSEIWVREPFTEYVPPQPLVARITGDKSPELEAKASLKATASGGDGEYTYGWDPAEGLSDATSATPTIDTTSLWTRTYTLTVTDGNGQTATSTFTVSVREEEEPAEPKPDGPPTGPRPWKDRNHMQVVMTLVHREGDARVGQVMLHNPKIRKTSYHQIGDEFDGGDLVYVHPRGAIVRKEDEWLVYPVGMTLNKSKNVENADDYPTLRDTASWVREALSPSPAEPAESGSEASGAKLPEPSTRVDSRAPSSGTDSKAPDVDRRVPALPKRPGPMPGPGQAPKTGARSREDGRPSSSPAATKPSGGTEGALRSSGPEVKSPSEKKATKVEDPSPDAGPKSPEDEEAEPEGSAADGKQQKSARGDEAEKKPGKPDPAKASSTAAERAKKRKATRDRAKKRKSPPKPRRGRRRPPPSKPKDGSSSKSE